MLEAAPPPTPEFSVGTKMPLLQHICCQGKTGIMGIIRSLENGKARTAECDDCHREIVIDWTAVQASKLINKKS